MLQGKRRKAAMWLPTQVAYGVDTSHPDPTQWKAFGELAEQQQESAKHDAPKAGTAAERQLPPAKP